MGHEDINLQAIVGAIARGELTIKDDRLALRFVRIQNLVDEAEAHEMAYTNALNAALRALVVLAVLDNSGERP